MAGKLTVAFEGLCGFVSRGSAIEAYVLSGHGMSGAEHGQMLVIRSDFIDVPQTKWMPSRVAMIRDLDDAGTPAFRQVAMWSLRKMEATIADGTGEPTWNKEWLIDFTTEHQGSSTKSKADLKASDPDVGIVTLTGSRTVLKAQPPGLQDNFTLKKNGVVHKQHVRLARVVEWQTSSGSVPTIQNERGEAIVLRDRTQWWATVSNVAPVMPTKGAEHFDHYYHAVRIDSEDARIKIQQQFADVYDCVPPVAFP
jgi:hypothetical protein